MDTIVTKTVEAFNPELRGKAVRVEGFDIDGEHWDRLFLVNDIEGEYIVLVNNVGKEVTVNIENFVQVEQALKLTILEEQTNDKSISK